MTFKTKGWREGVRVRMILPFSLMKNIFLLWIQIFRAKNVIVINLEEHVGDLVACEPVVRIVRREKPDAYLVWVTQYQNRCLVQHHPDIDFTLGVTCLHEWMCLKKTCFPFRVIDLHIDERSCSVFGTKLANKNRHGVTLENYYFHGGILEAFLMAADLPKQNLAPVFYFGKKIRRDCPEGLVVFHCASNEDCRNWRDDGWNDSARMLIEGGYAVAEVGLKPRVPIVHKNFHNYCGKLTLQEIAALIKKSKLFVGIDSAFAHFANAVETPGVILLGHYRDFKKYMPYSGRYKTGENATVLHYDGNVKDIPTSLVLEAIHDRLTRGQQKDAESSVTTCGLSQSSHLYR